MSPLAAFTVRVAASSSGALTVCRALPLLVSAPARATRRPEVDPSVKALAPFANEMLAKLVSAAKSSSGARRVAPAKTRSSPGSGVTSPTQFAAVVQRSSAPPPSQVLVEGATPVWSTSATVVGP